MEYSIEELLPIVEKLTQKYTSNESSSVTYETARMLMTAVLYCIDGYLNNESNELLVFNEKIDAGTAYQRGYDLVLSKVYKAKEIYDSFIENFKDFHCRMYRDTIIKGIPKFFIKYDPKFNPQDHILTLDYPTLQPIYNLCGVEAIYRYLCNIKIEREFLNAFSEKNIESLLTRIITDYKDLFCDNISYPVLLTSLGCMIANKPVGKLELQPNDISFIQNYFINDSENDAEQKIKELISKLFMDGFMGNVELKNYFMYAMKEIAVSILNGIRNHSLSGVFFVNSVGNDREILI